MSAAGPGTRTAAAAPGIRRPAPREGTIAALLAGAIALLAAAALWWSPVGDGAPALDSGDAASTSSVERDFGRLPLAFERNRGQSDPRVDYLARTQAATYFLTASGARVALAGAAPGAGAVDLRLRGGAAGEPAAAERLATSTNYMRGDDPARWQRDVPSFERVRYAGVYPGIDLDWYGNRGRLEYDFRVAPGADPARIAVGIEGADAVRVAADGSLLIEQSGSRLRQRPPVAYQPTPSGRRPVESSYELRGSVLGFSLGAYDRSLPLVIDPLVLGYSTYLGGDGNDVVDAIDVDDSGAAYLVGSTTSTDFETVGAIEGDSGDGGTEDVFVAKLNSAGNQLVYSTYLGGDGPDFGGGIAVDSAGAAHITGATLSSDFNTVGAIQGDSPGADAFVAKLNPAGSALAYSTYLGGGGTDSAAAIELDAAGAAYVVGDTASADFPRVDSIEGDSAGDDVFVAKLNPAGSALAYSTYLGGGGADSGRDLALDSAGSAYVTGYTGSSDFNTVGAIEGDDVGEDSFVAKLTPAGSALAYSTYLGGDGQDRAAGVAVDAAGAAHVAGLTASSDFNTVNQIEGDSAGNDAFAAKLNPAGGGLVYSTYLGGSGADQAADVELDPTGSAYVAGITASTDFDTAGEVEGDSGNDDAFLARLNPAGSALAYSTYLGGGSIEFLTDLAVDPSRRAYVAGFTFSSDFDLVGGVDGSLENFEGFVSRLEIPAPAVTATDPGSPANDNSVLVKGTASGGTTVRIYSSADCTGSPLAAGSAAAFASPGLLVAVGDDTSTALRATETDASGTSSSCSAPLTYVEDSTAPESSIGIVSLSPKKRSATVSFTASDAVSGAQALTLACSLDGAAFSPCGSPVTLTGLSYGAHTLSVRSSDQAGNTDSSPASTQFKLKKPKKKRKRRGKR